MLHMISSFQLTKIMAASFSVSSSDSCIGFWKTCTHITMFLQWGGHKAKDTSFRRSGYILLQHIPLWPAEGRWRSSPLWRWARGCSPAVSSRWVSACPGDAGQHTLQIKSSQAILSSQPCTIYTEMKKCSSWTQNATLMTGWDNSLGQDPLRAPGLHAHPARSDNHLGSDFENTEAVSLLSVRKWSRPWYVSMEWILNIHLHIREQILSSKVTQNMVRDSPWCNLRVLLKGPMVHHSASQEI